MDNDDTSIIDAYDREAEALSVRYESARFEDVHADALDLIPRGPGLVLDVGSGSGRDAAWFAAHGQEVIAIEPSAQMRRIARSRHPHASVRWLDDRLPALTGVLRTGLTFDLIWLSAVWMHLAPSDRPRAFRKLATVLRPGGRLVMTLRQGSSPEGRRMYPAPIDEIEKLARDHGLAVIRVAATVDGLGRTDVRWHTVGLQAPDDGLGALPLLRHVILNDSKASTYKLALLRVLVRIADSATGLTEDVDDARVGVPLGLVALFWIRAFKPLIEGGVPQKPRNRNGTGLGFVKAGFAGLGGVSPYDLRLGARFCGPEGGALLAALRDASNTIVRMPAHYITYPGQAERVFVAEVGRAPRQCDFVLDGSFMRAFGRLLVPRHIWHAMTRYAAWIEPALIEEWIALMQTYEGGTRRSHDDHMGLLRWLDPEHDTRLVRLAAEVLRERTGHLYCVWSGRPLRDQFAIDHCIPFAAWPCNDLWNLLPTHPSVNLHKGHKLPSAGCLAGSKDRILAWWHDAYFDQPGVAERFVGEATAALPGVIALSSRPSPDDVFGGLMMQRAVLRRDQQLPEWACP